MLSVIIVAYRSQNEIGPCLASIPGVLAQGESVEVLVVDNSPGEGTAEIVRDQFPHVVYIPAAGNLGFGRANNVGYAAIHPASDVVLFLNPDTICNEAALTTCVSRLRADPSLGLISPKLVLANGSMDLACRRSIPTLWDGFCRAIGLAAAFPRLRWFSGYNLTHLPEEGTYEVGAINGAFMMGRRTVFDAVAAAAISIAGASISTADSPEYPASRLSPPAASLAPTMSSSPQVFDESFFMYGDDLDLCIRVRKLGWKIVYDGGIQITHLKGLSVAKDYVLMSQAIFDANRDVYLKHFNPRKSSIVETKYRITFGLWKRVARLRARLRGHKQVRPL